VSKLTCIIFGDVGWFSGNPDLDGVGLRAVDRVRYIHPVHDLVRAAVPDFWNGPPSLGDKLGANVDCEVLQAYL
jgi:hypothetical protein